MTALGSASSGTGIALLFATALAAQQQAPAHDARAYLPLTPGTTWVYAVEHPAAPAGVTVTKRITRVLTVRGAPCIELAVHSSDPELALPSREYFAAERAGIMSWNVAQSRYGAWLDADRPPRLWLPCPAGLTTEWIVQERDPTGTPPREEGQLEGIGIAMATPAGEQKAALVRLDTVPAKHTRRLAFARGMGVLHEAVEHRGQPGLTLTLQEFTAVAPQAHVAPMDLLRASLVAGEQITLLEPDLLLTAFESRFARIEQGDEVRIVRTWRGGVSVFDPRDRDCTQRLLTDECIDFPAADHQAPPRSSANPPAFLFGLAYLELVRSAASCPSRDAELSRGMSFGAGGNTHWCEARLVLPDVGSGNARMTVDPGGRVMIDVDS
jgi:hypothetical protein